MSHIDEGELTAYADGAYAPDSADARRIREHLAGCANCRNRLSAAQMLSARASELLEYATPLESAVPDFAELQARAGAKRRGRVVLPLGWAATVILALGLGWLSRGMLAPTVTQNAASPVAKNAAVPRQVESAQVAAPPAQPAKPLAAAPPLRARAAPKQEQARATELAAEPLPMAAAPLEAAAAFKGLAPIVATGAVAPAPVRGPEYITPAEAEQRGIALHILPELEVLRVALHADTVVVEQKLPDARVLTITQSPAAVQLDAMTIANAQKLTQARQAAAAEETRRMIRPAAGEQAREPAAAAAAPSDSMRVVNVLRLGTLLRVSAPLPYDSLRALADKIR